MKENVEMADFHEEKVKRAKQMVERLEKQNEFGNVDKAQIEANIWRIKYLKDFIERPMPRNDPYIRLNPAEERLKNPDFQWSPSAMLRK